MPKPRIRVITALLALVVYFGQALTVAGAPCAPSTPPESHPSDMDHGSHHMAPAQGEDNCCRDGGFCSMSNCIASVALPGSSAPTDLPLACGQLFAERQTATASRRESLFRPPITH
jgi:hypothetical protein